MSLNLQKLAKQFLKFSVVGVIATLIDFGIMIFLTEAFGMNPVISAGISFCTSTVFNYLASMRFVFSHREELSRRNEFIIFVLLSLIGLGINQLVMYIGTSSFGEQTYIAVKIVATAIVMLWNFCSRKVCLDANK